MEKLLTWAELSTKLNLSKRQLRRLVEQGKLTEPVRISSRRQGWPESEIEAWLATRPTGIEKRNEEAKPKREPAPKSPMQVVMVVPENLILPGNASTGYIKVSK
jgi:predicted DNA-binding transcriptional regulator AlpA